MDKLYIIIKEQFPEVIEHEYPAFVAFVQTYYKWVEEQQSLGKIENVLDVDTTPERFVQYFRNQLDVYGIYNDVAPFDTKYIKTIKQIYTAKGSEKALIFLLKTVYNAGNDVKIRYPRDSILRASDGIWEQERFITVKTRQGSVPSVVNTILLDYENGTERLDISRIEILDSEITRFYFKSTVKVTAFANQTVRITDNNITTFLGNIILSPKSIEIENGGRDWQLGQIIVLPADTKNTLARVAQIDNIGTLQRVEILEYGHEHLDGERLIVSPYAVKPVGVSYDYDFDLETSTHTLTIFDGTEGTIETVLGTVANASSNSYFLENYTSQIYTATGVISQRTRNVVSQEIQDVSSPLTIAQWRASRATLKYVFGEIVTSRGKWLNSRGIISDNFIRLQDNYYYQQYSYVIESEIPRSRYQTMLSNLHQAGNKSFSNLLLKETLDVDVEVTTEIPFKWINVSDVATVEDLAAKTIELPFEDNNVDTSDSEFFTVAKGLSDLLDPVDEVANTFAKYLESESLIDDEDARQSIKSFSDEAIAFQLDAATSYNLTNYFPEQYGEPYFEEQYGVAGEEASLQGTLI
jgi:hypothetical protein